MDDRDAESKSWRLCGSRAELRGYSLAGAVDISHPELGLTAPTIDGATVAERIHCIRPCSSRVDWQLADSYVRGDDLVATYGPNGEWPYTTQVYWRAAAGNAGGKVSSSLSLFVSLQTHLLDTWPRLCLQSKLQCAEALFSDGESLEQASFQTVEKGKQVLRPSTCACCALYRLADLPHSYVEIMPANDFRELTVQRESDGLFSTSWELFAEFLEKGVIRRAQLHAAFLPRDNDCELAASLCKELERLPLPLTA